ncbi:MAG: ABC transporter ATP-binding protein [Thermoplasmata archaeon]
MIKDLMKVYKMGRTEVFALRGVNAEIKEGEFVAVVGPSGCGKTTLLNLIGGIDLPTAGSIIVKGTNICNYSEKELVDYRRRYVGMVFQFFNLVPTLTAYENVELPALLAGIEKKAREKRVMELLKSVGMVERAGHLPDEMSGGEQQRIAIATALVNNPAIILADEPTGELDKKTGLEILELFKALQKNEKKTLIVATHDPRIAEFADRILHMEDGKITGKKE